VGGGGGGGGGTVCENLLREEGKEGRKEKIGRSFALPTKGGKKRGKRTCLLPFQLGGEKRGYREKGKGVVTKIDTWGGEGGGKRGKKKKRKKNDSLIYGRKKKKEREKKGMARGGNFRLPGNRGGGEKKWESHEPWTFW